MYYIKWSKEDISGIESIGVESLLTEISNSGNVMREIGINDKGSVAHLYPFNKYKNGKHGFFDGQVVSIENLSSSINEGYFESLWSKAI